MKFINISLRVPEEIVNRIREIKAEKDRVENYEPMSLNTIYVRALAEGLGLDKTEGENG